MHSLFTPFHHPKIVDNHNTTPRNSIVSIRQAIPGRFLYIAVEPENREALNVSKGHRVGGVLEAAYSGSRITRLF
jgi:hypothetical protein